MHEKTADDKFDRIDEELKQQLDAVRRETVPDRLLQLAIELQEKLKQLHRDREG